jgi:hypothetical protein
MSYIDTFDHEYIGSINGLPIYHPLEEVLSPKWGDYDFACSPKNLVIGGGSGEHPGLILHKLEALVAKFICYQLSEEREENLLEQDLEWLQDLAWTPDSETLEFCGWSLRQMAEFVAMASSPIHSNPLREEQSAEDWLSWSIGELVYFSLPDLNPLQPKFENLMGLQPVNAIMRNVMCDPPGYPLCAGRTVENGKIHWGRYRWISSTLIQT